MFRYLLFVISISGACRAVTLIEPFELKFNSPSSESRGPLVFNITGQIILADPGDGCLPIQNTDETDGKILLLFNGYCTLELKLRNSQRAGAIGVINHDTRANEAGGAYYSFFDYNRDDIVTPLVFVNNDDGYTLRDIIANSTRVIANIVSGDRNFWKEANQSAGITVVNAIHCALNLGIAAFAVYLYVNYTREKRTTISVAQITMWLIIISMLVSFVFRILLHISANGIFNIPSVIIFIAPFFSDTMILCASLIVSFYWFELTSKASPVTRAWSKKLWTPFMIGVGLAIAMVILIGFWAQFIFTIETFIVILVIYVVITLGVAIIWIVFGARLRVSLLRDTSKVGEKNIEKFKKLIVCIILSACLLICTRIFTALMALAGASILLNRVIFHPLLFFFEFNALVILLLFTNKKARKNSSKLVRGSYPLTAGSNVTSIKSPVLDEDHYFRNTYSRQVLPIIVSNDLYEGRKDGRRTFGRITRQLSNRALFASKTPSHSALTLIEPFELTFNSPSSESRGPLVFNITGQIILADPTDGCSPIQNTDETDGKILIFFNGYCTLELKLRNAQRAGAIGVINHDTLAKEAGNAYYTYFDYNRDDIVIPLVFVNNNDGFTLRDIIANSTRVIANIVSGERNLWKEANQSAGLTIINAIHCALNLGIASFAVYLYIMYTRKKRTIISVAQITMWLIIIAMLVAFVFRIMLHISANGIFNIPYVIIFVAPFFSDTMILCASLIVSFYWFELTSKASALTRAWSKKLWTPFMIGVGLAIAMVILVGFWAQYIFTIETFIVILVIYVAITLGVAIVWIVFGARLRTSLLKDNSKVGQKNKQKFKKLIVCIILSACLLICTRIFTALMALAAASILLNRAIFQPLLFLFEFNALVILLLFTNKKASKNSSKLGSSAPVTAGSNETSLKSPVEGLGE